MHALLDEGGLTRAKLASKLVSFGFDGVNMFLGLKIGIAI